MSTEGLSLAELKAKVKVVIGEVNGLKTQLQNREITLEKFKEKKNILENILRGLLEEISKFKDVEQATPEVRHDGYIAEEANRLMYEFQTEFAEYISKPKVYISASLEDHFIFEIDFTNYPEKPKLKIPKLIQKLFLFAPLEQRVAILTHWNPQHPNHIIEIFYDIENILLNIFRSEEMSDPDLNQELVAKIMERRKLLAWAEHEKETYNTKKSVELYREVLQISKELEDELGIERYNNIIDELKKRPS